MERSNFSSSRYSVNKNIRFKARMLRSTLCNYNVACNVLKEQIAVKGNNDDKTRNKKLIFKKMPHLDRVYQKSLTHW